MILSPPAGYHVSEAIRDMSTGHPLLQQRWPALALWLHGQGFPILVTEVFRYDARQAWLFGHGRRPEQLAVHGLSASLSQPHLPVVTNAWSAATSAHGVTRLNESGVTIPAAAALDAVPVGVDGKPYTADDPWDAVIAAIEEGAPRFGLHHFRTGGRITDKPHLELIEYSNATHTLVIPTRPLAA